MVACFYGRTEAVKFLLESAIQSMEDEERDFERYTEKYDGNLDKMVSATLLSNCERYITLKEWW